NLNIPTFMELPERTVTNYLPDGAVSSSLLYPNRLSGRLNNPRSTAWNAEVQQAVTPKLMLGAGFNQRNTVHDYYIQPLQESNSGVLLLSNQGRNHYREFQVTARYQLHKHLLNASYVRSRSTGDLNDFNQFFGNTPNSIIRPN